MTHMAEPTLAELFGLPAGDALECREDGPYKGKKYPRRELTQVEQGYFSLWLEQEASAWVERQAAHLPPEALKAHRDGVRADAAAGKFHIYSEASLLRQNTLDGMAKLLSITLLADGHAEADHGFCKRLVMGEAEQLAARIGELAAAGDPKARAALDLFRSLTRLTATGSTPSSAGTSPDSSPPRSTGRKRKSAR